MKKIFALVLALVMAMSLATVAWGAPASTDVAKIGDTGYATLADAVTDANSATEAVTVELLNNVSVDAGLTINNPNATVTLDGKGYTVSPATGIDFATATIVAVNTDFVAKNITFTGFTCKNIISVNAGAECALEGCNFTGNTTVGPSAVWDKAMQGSIVFIDTNAADVSISGGTFENNASYSMVTWLPYGSAAKTIDIQSVKFEKNTTEAGVAYGADSSLYSVVINGCTFKENTITAGSGVVNMGDAVEITNNSFAGNTVIRTGGNRHASVIYTWGEEQTITGNTISDNIVNKTGDPATVSTAIIATAKGEDVDLSGNTVSGGTINLNATVQAAPTAIYIRGGDSTGVAIISSGNIEGAVVSASGSNIAISGGMFDTDVSAYLPADYMMAAVGNNGDTYVVGKDIVLDANNNIIGGTFSDDVSEFIADGYEMNANGTVNKDTPTPSYPPYYPPVVDDTTDKDITSPQTFDAGIALYVAVSVMGAVGTVVLGKKRED